MTEKITQLTPEQEALIPVYKEKWKAIALSTERINRQKAAEALRDGYAEMNHKKLSIAVEDLDIVFCDSPYAAWSQTRGQERNNWWIVVCSKLSRQLETQLGRQIERKLWRKLNRKLNKQLHQPNGRLGWQLREQLAEQFREKNQPVNSLALVHWFFGEACWFDFCITVLGCEHEPRKWETFQSLVENCGWIFLFNNTYFACDRPIKISFDNENQLHAEGEGAIQFVDGYSLYSYHGVTLPEKYGKLHPSEWQAQWLEQQKAELQQALIQGIGYERICQELQAIELDVWREYTLLKLNNA